MSECELVAACPECERANIRTRTARGRSHRSRDPDATYYCGRCGHCFNEIHYRPKADVTGAAAQPGTRGLAAQLAHADPDDDWGEIVQGGGGD